MKKHTLLGLAIIAIAGLAFTEDWVEQIVAKFDEYQLGLPPEKIYVHTDRSYYSTGETVWFKSYLVEGTTHTADTISKICYVDLVEKNSNRLIVQQKIKMNEATGHGQITLGDSLAAGEYKLIAYTNWMRNFDEAFWFTKTLRIFRTDATKKSATLPQNVTTTTVKVYPEGGQMLNNIDNRVAVEVTNYLGNPMSGEGFVLNANKDTITGFTVQNDGIANFNFKPEANQNYTLTIKNPIGGFQSVEMPKAVNEGFTIIVDNLTNKDNVRLFLKYQKPAADKGEFFVLAHSRGQIVHTVKGVMSKPSALLQIPKKSLPSGITHITVFNERGLPECERLIYLPPTEKLNINVKNIGKLESRGLATYEITTTNEGNQPVSANLSLSMIDNNQFVETEADNHNILTHFWLESDLGVPLPYAKALFDTTDINYKRKIDQILLTKGWRRFLWKDILEKAKPIPNFELEQHISVKGRVLRPNKKTAGILTLNLIVTKDSSNSVSIGQTNEEGYFRVTDLDFTDTLSLFIQAVTAKGNRNLNITIDKMLDRKIVVGKIPFNAIEIDAKEIDEYLKRIKEYQDIEAKLKKSGEKLLQEVTIKGKRQVERDSRKIYSNADATIGQDVLRNTGGQTIIDVLAGRVAGVQVSGYGQNATVQIRGSANFGGVVEPLFLLDGMQVDKSTILSVPINDVESIDVLKGTSASIFGSNASGGAISVLTKRGSSNYDWGKEIALGTLVTKVVGYAVAKEFVSPDYSKYNPDNVKPDFRTTVFWKPNIKTDANGKATVSFYLTDAKPNLKINVEGMTNDGRFGVN